MFTDSKTNRIDMAMHTGPAEIVLYKGETARRSHQALFALKDDCYREAGDDIVASITESAVEGISKIHLSADWEALLRVALWSKIRPSASDVISILVKSGASATELAPFAGSDFNDILPSLYYGKRFELLKKICRAAKARAESKIAPRKLFVHCHLISEETGAIIASSL